MNHLLCHLVLFLMLPYLIFQMATAFMIVLVVSTKKEIMIKVNRKYLKPNLKSIQKYAATVFKKLLLEPTAIGWGCSGNALRKYWGCPIL